MIGIFVGIRYLKNIPSSTTYTITLASCENGSFNIKVNDEEGLVVKKDDNVTVLPIADLNYTVEKVYYTQEDSANQIEITLNNGSYAFYMAGITSIHIPASVVSIGGDAFESCENLTTITFEQNSRLETIAEYAFCDCSNLTSIVFPSGVTVISEYDPFMLCDNLSTIYYCGNVEQWNLIVGKPTDVNVYCYSQSEPTQSGNYWHYNINGLPVVWE